MKIAYIYSTIATKGGTERMIAEKANYFSSHFGFDVTIITCLQKKSEPNTFYLSPKVKQINLEIPYYSQYKYKYPKRLWIKWKINKMLKKGINQTVKQEAPDIIIGTVQFQAHIVSSIKNKAIKIIECHQPKHSIMSSIIETQRCLLNKGYALLFRQYYLKTIERNADVIVTLTDKDKNLWEKSKRIEVIPNFSTMSVTHFSDCSSKRVIAVGRLDWIKGFIRLIDIWKIVTSKHPDWRLDIFGDGTMRNTLETHIEKNHVKNLSIHNHTPKISQEYAMSSICAVTSFYEGFSLVTLEAMKHGIPCVAFDCPFGPRTIINDGQCGFLVNDGDIRLFAERLCILIENAELRRMFSKAAIEKAKDFDIDFIMNKWKVLFESLTCS